MTLVIVGPVSQSTPPPAVANSDRPAGEGMRWSRRVLLVALALLAFLATLWTSLRPDLDDGWLAIGVPNPVAAIVWLVLFVGLLLQVSSAVRAFAIGIAFLLLWPAPVYASIATMALYGQFVMERTPATVTAADAPREGGPASVTFTFDDGTSERGVSMLSERFGSRNEYVAPRVGTRLEVLRDPTGWLPPRTAGAREGLPEGVGGSLLLALPGVVGVLGLLAASVSVLTRRESFIMVAGRPATADEISPAVAGEGRGSRPASS